MEEDSEDELTLAGTELPYALEEPNFPTSNCPNSVWESKHDLA
jgi:hypothetical protein